MTGCFFLKHKFEKLSSNLNLQWLSITYETLATWPLPHFQVPFPVSPPHGPVFQLYQTTWVPVVECAAYVSMNLLLLCVCTLSPPSGLSFCYTIYLMDFFFHSRCCSNVSHSKSSLLLPSTQIRICNPSIFYSNQYILILFVLILSFFKTFLRESLDICRGREGRKK